MTAAEQVQMEMVYGLAAVLADIDDHAIAGIKFFLAGDFGRSPQEMAEQSAVFGGRLGEGGDVLARNDEQMHRSLGVDVGEGEALLVLVDAGRGDASIGDFAEKAAHD